MWAQVAMSCKSSDVTCQRHSGTIYSSLIEKIYLLILPPRLLSLTTVTQDTQVDLAHQILSREDVA
jgi:hypothetical protein